MESLTKYVRDMQDLMDLLPLELVEEVIDVLSEARINSRKIFIMGNGGSASTATHFVADLAKNTRTPGYPDFRVIGLSDNMAILTAYANDEGYENVFANQLASLISPYDVVIGISTSGNSENILRAVDLARQVQATTIAFTGFDGGKLGPLVDLHIHVPSQCIEQVEDIHLIMEHMIVKTIREKELELSTFTNPSLLTYGRNGSDPGSNGKTQNDHLQVGQVYTTSELLRDLKEKIDTHSDISELMQEVLEVTVESVGASSGSLMMLDEAGWVHDSVVYYAGRINNPSSNRMSEIARHGLAGWVVENRQAAVVNNTHEDPRWLKRMWDMQNGSARSAISVPLIHSDNVVGVLTLTHSQEGRFTREDLVLLTSVAIYVAARSYKKATWGRNSTDE
jgi:D-sedoheptulose 7-phosphate isomerase